MVIGQPTLKFLLQKAEPMFRHLCHLTNILNGLKCILKETYVFLNKCVWKFPLRGFWNRIYNIHNLQISLSESAVLSTESKPWRAPKTFSPTTYDISHSILKSIHRESENDEMCFCDKFQGWPLSSPGCCSFRTDPINLSAISPLPFPWVSHFKTPSRLSPSFHFQSGISAQFGWAVCEHFRWARQK